jgi:sialate O-acetylesterase
MKKTIVFLSIVISFIVYAGNINSQNITLPGVIGNNMVIQQNLLTNLWGWGPANQVVSISASWGQSTTTIADSNGKWKAKLQTPKAVPGENQTKYSLTFVGKNNTVTLTNILIGDVYLCSGQSNMGFGMKPGLPWTLGVLNYETEIAAANYPNIRLNSVWADPSYTVTETNWTSWSECNPTSVAGFSAVAYYFAKELFTNPNINIPIGVIVAAVGGSSCQSWMRREALAADQVLKTTVLDPFDLNPNLAYATASTVLYNSYIAPLIPFSLKGFLWYQGEANSTPDCYSSIYTQLNSALIKDWRALWGQGDLPFYYVQLPAYNGFTPEFRDQQTNLLTTSNTGMVVALDLSDADKTNVHPRDKKNLGKRMASWAKAKLYGQNVSYSGPIYKSMKVEGNKVRITFHPSTIGRNLASRDGQSLNNFQIAGSNNFYYTANAVIDGTDVLVSSSSVANPTNVAFAYSNIPTPNLMNCDSLTACPFRTDRWNNTIVIDSLIQNTHINSCVGESSTFGYLPVAGSWSWTGPDNFTANTREITVLNNAVNQSDNYEATYTSVSGVVSKQSFFISVNAKPAISPFVQIAGGAWSQMSDNNVVAGQSIKFSPLPRIASGWSWTGPNGFTSTLRDPSIPVVSQSKGGIYSVTYTNSAGCSDAFSFNITVNATALTELQSDSLNEVQIYPNPSYGSLFIKNAFNAHISILDITGHEILTTNSETQASELAVNIKKFSAGLYFITIRNQNNSITKKFILQ